MITNIILFNSHLIGFLLIWPRRFYAFKIHIGQLLRRDLFLSFCFPCLTVNDHRLWGVSHSHDKMVVFDRKVRMNLKAKEAGNITVTWITFYPPLMQWPRNDPKI